jgi:hypothetical protein
MYMHTDTHTVCSSVILLRLRFATFTLQFCRMKYSGMALQFIDFAFAIN